MTDQTEIARIAEGLSELEREWVTGWKGPAGAAFNAIAEHLYNLGLLNGASDWTLNTLGLAVCQHLMENSDG